MLRSKTIRTLRLVTWVRKPCGWNVGLIHKKTSRREGGRSQRLTREASVKLSYAGETGWVNTPPAYRSGGVKSG